MLLRKDILGKITNISIMTAYSRVLTLLPLDMATKSRGRLPTYVCNCAL